MWKHIYTYICVYTYIHLLPHHVCIWQKKYKLRWWYHRYTHNLKIYTRILPYKAHRRMKPICTHTMILACSAEIRHACIQSWFMIHWLVYHDVMTHSQVWRNTSSAIYQPSKVPCLSGGQSLGTRAAALPPLLVRLGFLLHNATATSVSAQEQAKSDVSIIHRQTGRQVLLFPPLYVCENQILCKCIWLWTCASTHTHTQTHTNTHTHTHTNPHTHTKTCTHTHIHLTFYTEVCAKRNFSFLCVCACWFLLISAHFRRQVHMPLVTTNIHTYTCTRKRAKKFHTRKCECIHGPTPNTYAYSMHNCTHKKQDTAIYHFQNAPDQVCLQQQGMLAAALTPPLDWLASLLHNATAVCHTVHKRDTRNISNTHKTAGVLRTIFRYTSAQMVNWITHAHA